MYAYMQSAESIAADVEKAYLKASQEMAAERKRVFDSFRGDMKESEAMAILKRAERVDFYALEKLYRKMPDGEAKEALKRQMNAPAYRARIARLQKLQDNLDQKVKTLYKIENTASTALYRDLVKEAYYRTTYDLQRGTGIGYSFTDIDERQIDKIVHSNWVGGNYSARIWNNTSKVAESVKQQLLIATMTGKSYRRMASDIEEQFAVGASQARRLIRTEANYVANQAEAESYKDAGIDKYRFLATLDNRTSPMCQDLDNKVFRLDQKQVGVNYPPIHPWCRSTTTAVLDGATREGLKRRARDPETGRTYLVPADMTYKEWKESLTKEGKYLRVKNPEKVKREVMARITEEKAMLPATHVKILNRAVSEVNVVKKGHSSFNPMTNVITIQENIVPGEYIHECGHALYYALGLDKGLDDEYNAIIKDVINTSKIVKAEREGIEYYTLEGPMLISDYQGYVGKSKPLAVGLELLREFFSEGYRAFFLEPDYLKKANSRLYKFIKGLI